MGNSKSEEDKFREEFDKFYQDPRFISFDEHGNLVYGLVHSVSRAKQLRTILKLDKVDEEPGKEWFLMDSAWIASWLAYVHGDKAVAPAPGPCRNHRLIKWDYEAEKYKGRAGLFMAVRDRPGDYRRVSREVWEQFKEYYPGSGPSISLSFDVKKLNERGEYADYESWTIHDPPEPPEDAKSRSKKKKKRFTLKKLRKSKKDKKKDKENKENTDAEAEESEEEEGEEERDHPDGELYYNESSNSVNVVIERGADSDDDEFDDSKNKPAPRLAAMQQQRSSNNTINNNKMSPAATNPAKPITNKPAQESTMIATLREVSISQRDKDSDDDEDDDFVNNRNTNTNRASGARNTSIDYAAANAEQARRESRGSSAATQSVKRGEMLQQVYFKD